LDINESSYYNRVISDERQETVDVVKVVTKSVGRVWDDHRSAVRESHPRKWVDGSSTAYKESRPPPFVLLSLSPRNARGEKEKKNGNPGCVPVRIH
jgi:hypothetical protein